jgi:hypothetical protein
VALFRLSTEVLLLPPYPSKLAVDLACFAINFVAMNSYVFHAREGLAQFLVRARAATDGAPVRFLDRHDGGETTQDDCNAS